MPHSLTRILPVVCLSTFCVVVSLGCGGRGPTQRPIEVKQSTKLDEVKAILGQYATGSPLTSEAEGFDLLIEEVRKTDPAKGNILAKELPALKKLSGTALQSKAKELLKKL
ncbi:MAG: hypothetical protein LC104_19735 [Bacteroidales bacterium]|nr:hypothetical protein [Bacteroidales bacterium]